MEMDINFRKDDDRKVESDMEMDNFQTENMDLSLGKPYLDKYFNSNLAYPAVPEKKLRGTTTTEVFRVIINMEGGREVICLVKSISVTYLIIYISTSKEVKPDNMLSLLRKGAIC